MLPPNAFPPRFDNQEILWPYCNYIRLSPTANVGVVKTKVTFPVVTDLLDEGWV